MGAIFSIPSSWGKEAITSRVSVNRRTDGSWRACLQRVGARSGEQAPVSQSGCLLFREQGSVREKRRA